MVLEFPVMADYMILADERASFFVTHGHLFHEDRLPPMRPGDVLIHGHTHVPCAKEMDGFYLLNPGSVTLPKEGNPQTYAVYENGSFAIWDFDGNLITQLDLTKGKAAARQ